LVNLLKKTDVGETYVQELIRQWSQAYEIVPVEQEQLLDASSLRASHNLSYWDSLIVASALSADCTILYTEDLQGGQTIRGRLTIINPFEQKESEQTEG
jgi:predicted nucleic acid-binding protein